VCEEEIIPLLVQIASTIPSPPCEEEIGKNQPFDVSREPGFYGHDFVLGMQFIWIYLLALAVAVVVGKALKIKWADKALPYVTATLLFVMGIWAGNEARSLFAVADLLLESLEILVPSTLAGYLIALAFGGPRRERPPGEGRRSKMPFLFLFAAASGWALGVFVELPSAQAVITWLLILLVVVIGVDMGPSITLNSFKRDLKQSWIPFSALAGALLGGLISSFAFGMDPKFAVASAAGLGWYSLDGPLLSSYFGPRLGMVGFLTNFLREQMTFFVVPLLRDQKSGALLTLGGSTTMDDTLSLYAATLGDEYKELALFNGLVLSLVIPFLLPAILAARGWVKAAVA